MVDKKTISLLKLRSLGGRSLLEQKKILYDQGIRDMEKNYDYHMPTGFIHRSQLP